jgi:DNA-binding IclR family transcriptional regulator
MARSASGESVLERVVRIFECFEPDVRVLTVSDISRRSGLPLSTASRLCEDLVGHGLLSRDERRRLRVGVRLWELASRASPTLGLREAALPFMEDLHAVVGHHTQLGVLDHDEVLFVERLSAPGAVINVTKIAGRLPLHASSSGLVLLAHAPASVQERVIAGPLEVFTEHGLRDGRTLRRFLAEVRRQGYAYCPGFIHPDAAGLAVPVRDRRDRVIAALSVIVPNDELARGKVSAVQAAARGIRRAMEGGFVAPPG